MTDEIEALFAESSTALFQKIGIVLTNGAMGVDDDDASDNGREWWQRNRQELSRVICGSYVVRVYLESPRAQNRSVIVAAIADLIVSVCGGVPPIVVSVLIVNEGLDSFCQSIDQGNQS